MCEGEGMGMWWPEDTRVESPGVEGLGVYTIQARGGLRCGRHNTCQKSRAQRVGCLHYPELPLLSRTVGDIAGIR